MLGMAHLKGEGAPLHPDDLGYGWHPSDERYQKQLRAYNDHYGFANDEKRDPKEQ